MLKKIETGRKLLGVVVLRGKICDIQIFKIGIVLY